MIGRPGRAQDSDDGRRGSDGHAVGAGRHRGLRRPYDRRPRAVCAVMVGEMPVGRSAQTHLLLYLDKRVDLRYGSMADQMSGDRIVEHRRVPRASPPPRSMPIKPPPPPPTAPDPKPTRKPAPTSTPESAPTASTEPAPSAAGGAIACVSSATTWPGGPARRDVAVLRNGVCRRWARVIKCCVTRRPSTRNGSSPRRRCPIPKSSAAGGRPAPAGRLTPRRSRQPTWPPSPSPLRA